MHIFSDSMPSSTSSLVVHRPLGRGPGSDPGGDAFARKQAATRLGSMPRVDAETWCDAKRTVPRDQGLRRQDAGQYTPGIAPGLPGATPGLSLGRTRTAPAP